MCGWRRRRQAQSTRIYQRIRDAGMEGKQPTTAGKRQAAEVVASACRGFALTRS